MKKRYLVFALSVIAISFFVVNVCAYSYWGRRHKVLYDVDSVIVSRSIKDENIYFLTYKISVKNWWFDFKKHTYKLKNDLGGSPGGWHFEGETQYFTSVNYKQQHFDLTVEFDVSSYDGSSAEPVKDAIMISRFAAYNSNGEEQEGASLYMSDFPDVDVVYQ